MTRLLRRIADSAAFQNFITVVILLAGAVIGMQTDPSLVRAIGPVLDGIDQIILGIFVVEVVVKVGAEGSKPWRYFSDPWLSLIHI